MARSKSSTAANLGFEEKLWQAADKLRSNMDAAEYKHVVLRLIFLKYISDSFKELHQILIADHMANPENKDDYTALNIFWVPALARWSYLQGKAHTPEIGKLIDDAMLHIEQDNRRLKNIIPKNYARSDLDKAKLGELIDLIGPIGLGDRDIRRAIIEADLVDCMVALPGQRIHSTQIHACLWLLSRNKAGGKYRNRRRATLIIDARNLDAMWAWQPKNMKIPNHLKKR